MFTEDSYTEPCGCIWQHGKRIRLCPRHKHKDTPFPSKEYRYRC